MIIIIAAAITRMSNIFNLTRRCRDLADLIYCGRLPCKIDAVRGIIEAVRMDSHNAL